MSRGLGKSTIALRAVILDVLQEFDISMSTRQVYYQAVSRGAVENSVKGYRKVCTQVLAMRRDGSISYDRIVDRTRAKHQRAAWDGASDILSACASQFRRNAWTEHVTIPMIACEKQALEGIFSEACDRYGVSLWVIRGFNSESFEYEWAEEIKRLTSEGHRVSIAYFGDWDPSGLSIEANSQRKLFGFGADFEWTRAGLLQEDIAELGLVRVPLKKGDSRTKRFRNEFGSAAAELDALPPDELQARIHTFIETYINEELWDRIERDETVQRESLQLVADNWQAAVAGARGAA